MRRLVVIPAITGALFMAACGNGGGEDVLGLGDRGLDRCSLVTAAEVESWLGSPLSVAPSEGFDGEPDPVTCLYEGAAAKVLVQIYDGEVFYAEVGSPVRTGENLSGLGEDAWTARGEVHFLQNDWSVSVSRILGLVDDADLLEMAKLIASRLP